MSEYRHFIAYIYEYQNGDKKKNTGFVKVNIRNGICRIQMKIQTDSGKNGTYSIYGFVHEGNWLYGISVGTAVLKKGLCEGVMTVPEEVFRQKGYTFDRLSGLWVQKTEETGTPQQEYFLTIWDERSVDWKQFVTELPEEDKQAGESKMQLEGEADSAVNSAEQPAGNMDFPGNVTESMEAAAGSKRNEGIQSTDAADVEQKVAVQEVAAQEVGTVGETADSQTRLDSRWAQFRYHYPHTEPFEDGEIFECLQIAPKDIAFLGNYERMFCSSPFVQQKYMKYHHLLLGKHQDGRYILAVPGLNRNVQDRNLAAMYGFPEFKKTEEENGYWYHFLS